MQQQQAPEVWMRGPIPGITGLLQPAAHAVLQVKAELAQLIEDYDNTRLWEQTGGVASAGFHLQHMTGVLDRLGTYAQGNLLSEQQMLELQQEGKAPFPSCTAQQLADRFYRQTDLFLELLKNTPETELLSPRGIGRKQLPSNVLGILFHAAEHSQRHLGQLLVTIRLQRLL
ncbi:DinB family protein [Filimonas effusa]|uniref:DinB family protein n=1 Tax=Filimonas effusa TaxID=2508721 RepID=A0A4Q1D4T8_9BACT|nr:DinB family protein [Filimonas effusa]RXK83358.1 DinB family protein [Filimonas effusa]